MKGPDEIRKGPIGVNITNPNAVPPSGPLSNYTKGKKVTRKSVDPCEGCSGKFVRDSEIPDIVFHTAAKMYDDIALKCEHFAERNNLILGDHKKTIFGLLAANTMKVGKPLCPCQRDAVCPCPEGMLRVERNGECDCGLFKKM